MSIYIDAVERLSSKIVAEARRGIRERADLEQAELAMRFFKDQVEICGLRSAQTMEVVKLTYPSVKGNLPLAIEVAGELIESKALEETSVGIILPADDQALHT